MGAGAVARARAFCGDHRRNGDGDVGADPKITDDAECDLGQALLSAPRRRGEECWGSRPRRRRAWALSGRDKKGLPRRGAADQPRPRGPGRRRSQRGRLRRGCLPKRRAPKRRPRHRHRDHRHTTPTSAPNTTTTTAARTTTARTSTATTTSTTATWALSKRLHRLPAPLCSNLDGDDPTATALFPPKPHFQTAV